MSIFEDVLEVWHNAEDRLERERTIDALREAVNKPPYAHPFQMVVILDWNSAYEIADQLASEHYIMPSAQGLHPEEYTNMTCRTIEMGLNTKTQVHAVDSSTPFAVALNPEYVNYKNEIMAQNEVYAIDFVQVDE